MSGQAGRFQIRGCGDPMCRGCNAHIPEEVASTMTREVPTSVWVDYTDPSFDRVVRDVEASFRSAQENVFSSVFGNPNPKAAVSRQPPTAYTEARSKVEKYLLKTEHSTGWDDVVGNEEAKQALLEAIEEPVRNAELYAHYGMRTPKGIVLYGPPGCGKTMFVKAAAAAMSRIHGRTVDVISVAGSSLQSPFIGVTEATIRAMFVYAREYRAYHGHPLLLFVDEAEVILPDRTGRRRAVASWEESQVAEFLSQMDGMEQLGAFVVLATNRPEEIDEALMRDGRCDRKIRVSRPGREAVEVILRRTLAGIPLAEGTDLEALVFAGTEAFHDPHYVIHEGSVVRGFMSDKGEPQVERIQALNFCLEHVINGAMVTGIAARARSRAFRRDREAGTRSGLTVSDVIDSVREVFEENKGLEHAYAVREFVDAVPVKEIAEAHELKQHGRGPDGGRSHLN